MEGRQTFALWHRATRKHPWTHIATLPTHAAAAAQINGRGDWLVTRPGADPNSSGTIRVNEADIRRTAT